MNSLTNDDQQVQNGTYVTDRTRRKHRAADFHANSQEPIEQAIKNLNIQEDEESDDTDETIRSDADTSDSDGGDYESHDEKLERSVVIFLVWLHLNCGVSRENCRTARDYVLQIIKDSQHLSSKTNVSKIIPKDIRTAMKRLDVIPELTKSIC